MYIMKILNLPTLSKNLLIFVSSFISLSMWEFMETELSTEY